MANKDDMDAGEEVILLLYLVTRSLQVPWRSLGRTPVVVEMDRLFILAGPKQEAAEDLDVVGRVMLLVTVLLWWQWTTRFDVRKLLHRKTLVMRTSSKL